MLKFAKSKYSSFENSKLELKLYRNDVFAVTSEIENSEVYQMGVSTKNFVPVTIGNMVQLSKVVNLTDEIKSQFKESIQPVVVIETPKMKYGADEVPVIEPEEVIPVVEEITITVQDAETTPEYPDNDVEPEVPEPEEKAEFIIPDNLGKMNYAELQTFALAVEKFYDAHIDRGAKKADLLAEIKAVLKMK